MIAAESNPEGAPAGGISALVYGVLQPLTNNILPTRNDTWVVPPHSSTNFLPFLSGSGESENVRISLAECGSEQPELVARNTAAKNQYNINIGGKIPLVRSS